MYIHVFVHDTILQIYKCKIYTYDTHMYIIYNDDKFRDYHHEVNHLGPSYAYVWIYMCTLKRKHVPLCVTLVHCCSDSLFLSLSLSLSLFRSTLETKESQGSYSGSIWVHMKCKYEFMHASDCERTRTVTTNVTYCYLVLNSVISGIYRTFWIVIFFRKLWNYFWNILFEREREREREREYQ